MGNLFQTILYQPIFNLFVGLYALVGDIGIAILLMTVIIKLFLWPLTAKSIKAQQSLSALQPKLQEAKEKYKGDQQQVAQETMKIYKEHKVNPLGSCLPILVQIPIFLALYWVLKNGLTNNSFDLLYSFIPSPGHINPISLGLFDFAKPSILFAVLAGAAQFWHAKGLQRKRPPAMAGSGAKDEDMMAMMNKQMLYMMPVLTVFVSVTLPGGIALYWFLSTLITAIQQKMLEKKFGTGAQIMSL